jgi:hypothetical protein
MRQEFGRMPWEMKKHVDTTAENQNKLKHDSIGTYLQLQILTTPQPGGRSWDIFAKSPRFILAANRYSCDISPSFFAAAQTFQQQPIAHGVCITLSVSQIHVSTCSGPPFLLSVETISNGWTGGSVMVNVAEKKCALRRGDSGYKKFKQTYLSTVSLTLKPLKQTFTSHKAPCRVPCLWHLSNIQTFNNRVFDT